MVEQDFHWLRRRSSNGCALLNVIIGCESTGDFSRPKANNSVAEVLRVRLSYAPVERPPVAGVVLILNE
jgi:hypothetical protein